MRIDKYRSKFENYLNGEIEPESYDRNLYCGGLSEKASKEAREAYEKSKKIYLDAQKKGIRI